MLSDRQLKRYAEVLLWGLATSRSGRIKKGDIFLVRYHRPAVALAETVCNMLVDRGFNPVQRMEPTIGMERHFYANANARQLVFQPPGEPELFRGLNGSIFLYAPESLTYLSDIDPRRISRVTLSRKGLRDIMNRRDEQGVFSWTLCLVPTPALAEHAGQSLDMYTRQVIRACFLNRTDPVSHWRRIHRQVSRIKRWLDGLDIRRLHIQSNRIDLTVTPGDRRRWLGVSGHNIPSFEVFISPDWRGTNGVYYADQPSFRSGNCVKGIRLTFRDGTVRETTAEAGAEFVRRQLHMDKGAGRVGEFSLTDRRFSKIDTFMANTLYDENYGGKYGNCHVALGASYSDSYRGDPAALDGKTKQRLGFNESALHWDMVNTEDKQVTAYLAGGRKRIIYEKGMFAH